MSIFGFFNGKQIPFQDLFQRVERSGHSFSLPPEIETEILQWSDEQKVLLIISIVQYLNTNHDLQFGSAFKLLIEFVTKQKISFGEHLVPLLTSLLEMFQIISKADRSLDESYRFLFVIKPLLTNIFRFHKFEKQEEKDILTKIQAEYEKFDTSIEVENLLEKIEFIIPSNYSGIRPTYFFGQDEFQLSANKMIESQTEQLKTICFQIIRHARRSQGSKPSKKYLKETNLFIQQIGLDNFKRISREWFDLIRGLNASLREHEHYYTIEFLDSANTDVLKGIIWMYASFQDLETPQIIGKLAEKCFQKIPNKGSTSAALGNACLYVLASANGLSEIAQLSKLKQKIKLNSTGVLIEKYIQTAAQEWGVSMREIEDIAVDDFGLKNKMIEVVFDDYKAILELTGIGKSVIRWYKQDGSEQKTVPQSIKDTFSDRLKQLKEQQKQINQTTSIQRDRFDQMLRSHQTITLDYLKEKYLNHELLSFVIEKIIFLFSNEKEQKTALFIGKKWICLDCHELDIDKYTNVTLWHPATSTVQEVKEWRKFLMDSQIQQPFKQAYREIYLLTDAELNTGTYSNRMAAHILKQHQYVALAQGRNWKAKLMGAWDGGDQNIASLLLPDFKMKVEFWVNALGEENNYNQAGIWNYIITDQIRFINTETNESIDLASVPVIIFSEVMRDVDLFVGVASVGNDPNWIDSGELPDQRNYWQSYSFGDLSEMAKNRKEFLQDLIPRLKIAPVASISGNFLIIQGTLRTYKIHIGSANILMEPNDQYLCIVPQRTDKNEAEKIFLPFEGDTTLSIILSKAFLLANDLHIIDKTILSQIQE